MYFTTINNVTLVVNRTHYGVGDHFLYSTTAPLSYALYGSILFFVLVVCTTLVLCCRLQRQIRRYQRKYKIYNSDSGDDDTKATALLAMEDPRMGELLGKFQWEVRASEVLTYAEEEHDPYLRNLNTITTTDEEENDIEAAAQAATASGATVAAGPPVVDGFYSITADDPCDTYNEDMYLEFLPHTNGSGGCSIQGFGKYDNGNFRVGGSVSSTGAAYWYEESYGTSGPTTMILARGTFERNADTGIVQFTGHWYSDGGKRRGVYKLFSHNVLYISSTAVSVHSVAESTTGSSVHPHSTNCPTSSVDGGTTMGDLSNATTMDSHQSVYEIADERIDAMILGGDSTTLRRSVTLEDPDNISPLGNGSCEMPEESSAEPSGGTDRSKENDADSP